MSWSRLQTYRNGCEGTRILRLLNCPIIVVCHPVLLSSIRIVCPTEYRMAFSDRYNEFEAIRYRSPVFADSEAFYPV